MCEKVAYPNKKTAHKALRTILRGGKRMRAYQCEKCFKYHVTSQVNTKY